MSTARLCTRPVAHRTAGSSLIGTAGRVCACLILLLAILPTAPAWADPDDEEGQAEHGGNWLAVVWGTAQPNTAYVGMWTRHVSHPGVDNNELMAGVYHGFFGGTFINSYGKRTWAGGVERNWVRGAPAHDVGLSVGYRLGGIYGYNHRLMSFAEKTPVLPFVQVVGNASYKKVGVQASYCWLVFTSGFFVRF